MDDETAAPTLRAARPEDEPFQFALFCERRGEPLRRAGVPAPVLDHLMEMQFRARALEYGRAHPEARWLIVEIAGEPVGELVLDAVAGGLHVVDISLAAAHRGRGHGPAALRLALSETASGGEARALIDPANGPSRKMFAKLGFAERRYDDAHVEAVWRKG